MSAPQSAESVSDEELDRYETLQQQALDFARQGETATLARMVDVGLSVNLQDAKGNSLLMLASYNQQLDTAQMLLEKGADSNRRNDRGQTPLGGVAFKGYSDIAEILIDGGAEVDADNGGGMTPLMYARMFGRNQVAELLLQKGADERKKSKFGLTAKTMSMLSSPVTKAASFFRK